MAATAQHDVDHYEVLGLPSGEEGEALSIEQIKKAYKAQSLLRHPDKRPNDPSATADFKRLVSSYELLLDESLRREFDAHLRARRQAAAARAAATGIKRDLEERERAFAAGGGSSAPDPDPAKPATREDKRMAAVLERELEDKGKVLKVSWKGGADYYTAAKLDEIFTQFGEVEGIVITRKSKSKGLAVVAMASREAARTALKNHSVYNVFPIRLKVAPVEESGRSPAFATEGKQH